MTLDCLCLLLFCSELLTTRFASHLFRHDALCDQPGLGPGTFRRSRYTTVDDPPERWFQETSSNLTGVAQLRLAHAHTQLRAPTGATELTTQFHETVSGLRTPGQNTSYCTSYFLLPIVLPTSYRVRVICNYIVRFKLLRIEKEYTFEKLKSLNLNFCIRVIM